jgi:hypothetical protein
MMNLQYLGIDWLATALTFPAIHLISQRSRNGFLLMIAANLCWTGIGLLAGSTAMTLANIGFLAMNVHGWRRWSRLADEPQRIAPHPARGRN